MKKYATEIELAADVVEFLKSLDFEIWQEVEGFGGIADIVAMKNEIYFCFETKKTLSDDLLEQCKNRSDHFHYTFATVPHKRNYGVDQRNRITDVKRNYIDHFNIGVWLFETEKDYGWSRRDNKTELASLVEKISERCLIVPKYNDTALVENIKKRLFPEQKKSIAGSQSGGASTAFKRSCDAIIAYLEENPGVSKKEIWNALDLHWSSYSSFTNSIRTLEHVDRVKHINQLLNSEIDSDGQMRLKL